MAAFGQTLLALKIYSTRYVYYLLKSGRSLECVFRKIYLVKNMLREQSEQMIFSDIAILHLYLQLYQQLCLICIVMRNNKGLIRQTYI